MARIPYLTHEDALKELLSSSFWPVVIKTYDESDNLTYVACNRRHLAVVTDEDWYIWKYTYDGSNRTLEEGPLKGAQSGQASLAWRA